MPGDPPGVSAPFTTAPSGASRGALVKQIAAEPSSKASIKLNRSAKVFHSEAPSPEKKASKVSTAPIRSSSKPQKYLPFREESGKMTYAPWSTPSIPNDRFPAPFLLAQAIVNALKDVRSLQNKSFRKLQLGELVSSIDLTKYRSG